MTWEPTVINGHPVVEMDGGNGNNVLITVCAHCERMRTVLFLTGDRWLCTNCRAEGTARPNLIPIGTKEV